MSETPIGGRNQQGTTYETEPVSDTVPPGPGALTVHLDSSYRLSLPHDPDLQDSEWPAQGTTFSSRDVKTRYRWRFYTIVEYEGFQVSSEATYVKMPGSVSWAFKDNNERRYKVIGQELQLPDSLPSTVKDILIRLLDKDPTKRLGANGAAEVKFHLFFYGLKWTGCLQRKIIPPFKPHDAATVFSRKSAGVQYKETDWTDMLSMFNYPADWPQRIRESRAAEREALLSRREDDRWDLVWDLKVQEFHFKNRFTDEKAPAKPEETNHQRKPPPSPETEHPSERQKEDALGAALEAGYSKRVILQVLRYCPNLNANVLHFEHTPTNSQLLRNSTYATPVTPLEWAAEHERLDLVNLFLDRGANVDSTHSIRDGPALLKAVRKRNNVLVKILVQKTTDRVSHTRALALAVEQEDTVTATILLINRVCCDFEESDRPLPEDPLAYRGHDSLDLKLLRAHFPSMDLKGQMS